MGDLYGFLKVKRKEAGYRPVHERVCDYSEVEQVLNSEDRMLQASRCMDCGTPFCHWGCPLDNLIPEWNDLLYKGGWKAAYQRLVATNNFPEFTGRVCPAPCEHSCVLNLQGEPVTIRENEVAIVERAFAEGYVRPQPPQKRTGKRVAVVGSGPAGLATADQLNKLGHEVIVFEKAGKAGGLLRYGIPDFKLNKTIIDRRLDILVCEGIVFRTGTTVGRDITAADLLAAYDAVCLAIGAGHPRDLQIEGRNLPGIHFALDYLTFQNKLNDGDPPPIIDSLFSAHKKAVVVIGGGDTGADCVGTAVRQRAFSVTQIEILPKPPLSRTPDNPWPYYARVLKTSTSHQEGCDRLWATSTKRFIGENNRVVGVEVEAVNWVVENGRSVMRPVPGSSRILEADIVLLALGFAHPVLEGITADLGLEIDERKNIKVGRNGGTSIPKVFAVGDAVNGAGLVVGAMASGRRVARAIDEYLRGQA
jgi:glutamate synthase (NADPH/NADH) small chain